MSRIGFGLRALVGAARCARPRRSRRGRQLSVVRPRLEGLESRELLASFLVDSPSIGVDVDLTDGACATLDGDCTLVAAIQQANANPDADQISFSVATASSTGNFPIISSPLDIEGDNQVRLRGNLRIQGDDVSVDGIAVEGRITIQNATDVTVSNTTVFNSSVEGIRIVSSSPSISGVSLNTNSAAAISMDLSSNPTFDDITFSGNAVNGVVLDAGVIPDDAVWDDGPIAYRLSGDVTVPANTTLTVSNGQVVQALAGVGHDLIVNGTLVATGTEDDPVIFTSDRDDDAAGDTNGDGDSSSPQAGDWNGIRLNASSSENVLEHVEVRYGGASVSAGLIVAGAASISNIVLGDSATAGVRIDNSDPTIVDAVFQNNALAVSMDLLSNPDIRGVTLTGNGTNALVLDRGTLVDDAVWDDSDIVYHPVGSITVPEGRTLTVGAGVVVKSRSGGGDRIIVNGTLISDGSAAEPIVFTTLRDDSAGGDTNNDADATSPVAGQWNGIELTSTSTNNLMDHSEVRYGGANSIAQLIVRGPLTMSDGVVRDSASAGMRIENSSPVLGR